MTQDDDRLLEALAGLRTITPHSEWEKRVRARCHSEIEMRATKQIRIDKHLVRRLSFVDVAALAVLCFYLSALLQDAARLGGLR
jgi:hypothetical protein